MATVEIDENELRNLNTIRATVDTIVRHPGARKLVEQAHKMVNPNAPTPTLDAESASNEPIQQLTKSMADLRKEMADEKAERDKNEKISFTKKRYDDEIAELLKEGWMKDGLEAIEKVSQEKGVFPLDAAAIHLRNNPPPAPATPSGAGNWGFQEAVEDGDEYTKKLLAAIGPGRDASDNLAMREAGRLLADIKRR